MHYSSLLLTLATATLLGSANAAKAVQGFNYGNKRSDGTLKNADDFKTEFTAAQKLAGTNGAFSSARLYTMIQGDGGAPDAPISAIQAALDTKTTLLLGMWTSGDPAGFKNELSALNNALTKYGQDFVDIIDGISVGSEDLYRISPIGVENKSGVGLGPDELISYIQQVRKTLTSHKTLDVSKVTSKIGHVDTWTAWVNGTNKAVIDNCDWVGVDAYPYWQSTMANNISVAGTLFFEAIDNTKKAAGSKPVWITETGWPVEGNKSNLAIADEPTAELFYKGVGCKILGSEPTWWYILNEKGASPDFSVADENYKPLYDLNCGDAKNADPLTEGSSSSSSSSSNSTSSGSGSSGNNTSSGNGGSSSNGGSSAGSSTNDGSSAPTSTDAGKSAASATHAANCMFALVLAGIVALMI